MTTKINKRVENFVKIINNEVMNVVINPKTNKPYTQDEMQTAFQNEQELEYYIKVPDGELLFSMIPHREYIIDAQGVEKEVYTL